MDKVIIVIVEGESDKSLIADSLEECFEDYDVDFAVVGNDVFNMSRTTTIKDNINRHIKNLKSIKKFIADDILCVIHISDTDGCFIDNDSIVIDSSQTIATVYDDNNITVNSEEQKSNIKGRNKSKRNNTNVMITENTISFERRTIDYQVFYFSRHLEHVIFNNPNPSKRAKVSEVDDFLAGLTTDLESWLRCHIPELDGESYSERYQSSWLYIKKDNNSLKRSTSVPLVYEYIKSEIV